MRHSKQFERRRIIKQMRLLAHMAVSLERSAPGLNPIVFLRFNAVKTWMPPASGQQRQETTEESYFWFTEK